MTHHYTILRHTWDQQAVALEDNIYIFAGFTCDSVTIADPCTSAKYRWKSYRIDQKLRIGWLNRCCWHILSPRSVTNLLTNKLPQKLKTSRFWFTSIPVNPKTILHVGRDSNPQDIEYVTHAEAWQLQPDGSFYISRTKWGEDDWSLYPGVFIL